MKRHEATIFDFVEDNNDILSVTSHEGIDGTLTIHATTDGYSSLSMYITQAQAEDLIGKLQKAIINLEVAKRTEGTKEEV